MIIFILTLVIAIIGFIVVCLTNFDDDLLQILGCIFFDVGALVAFFMTLMIVTEHVSVSATIAEKQIEYESLCERKELISSEYEDVSMSDVIKDIAEWNWTVLAVLTGAGALIAAIWIDD